MTQQLHITVVVYGSHGRRVEIEMRPTVPANIEGNVPKLAEWTGSLCFALGKDVKHSEKWACSVCGQPARETSFSNVSWIHLTPPKMTLYVFHVCDMDSPECAHMIDSQQAMMARMTGQRGDIAPRLPKPPGVSYPLSASCAKCNKDSTGAPEFKTSRCGKCKLTRYCSVDCQREDWARHKTV
ncbi:hypothetical protein PLICRDRAFT_608078 [Plicaturopsis crispa FD-325 SS-3]|nr:hypothetical protein PLICRDRAFT_608078 [Plicaturopsis crispa FD-325 SS-3]